MLTSRDDLELSGGTTETLKEQRKRVVRLCLLACMIAPYKERATFVQQTLNAFL